MIEVFVIGRDDSTLHRADMVRIEKTVRGHQTESPGSFVAILSPEALAVVLQNSQPLGESSEIVWVSEDVNGEEQIGVILFVRRPQFIQIIVERSAVDIHKPQLPSILLERTIGG